MKKEFENKNQKSKIRRRKLGIVRQRSAIWTLLLTPALCLLSAITIAAGITDGDVDKTRSVLEKWVETRRIISQEKHDFELAREMLSERIELVGREIESLRGKISDAEKSISETDKKRAELLEENEKLKEISASLSVKAIDLEGKTKELLKRLPDLICERVKPLSQRMTENPEETKLSLSERFQNIAGILNEVNKFNRETAVTSEVRKLPDGTSVQVTVLYIGIGQAYYVNGKGDVAGIGTASSDGWVWMPANESAVQIAKAISIFRNDTVAAFVQLPVKIQ